MALELSTAGIKVKYCVETTSGTRPSSSFITIPGVKSIPSFNPEPSTLEVTDLSDTAWKRYIPGLKDPGGAIGLTVNMTTAFKSAWGSFVSAAQAGASASKATWIEFSIPQMDSFYFPCTPSELGFNGADTDSVLENVAYITPNGAPVWAAAST